MTSKREFDKCMEEIIEQQGGRFADIRDSFLSSAFCVQQISLVPTLSQINILQIYCWSHWKALQVDVT